MKRLINFGGTNLSVNYNKEVAESIKSSLNTLYINLTHITLPKISIQNIEDESKKWYKNYMSNLDTTLTGDQLIAKGDKILQDAKDLDDEMTRTVNILSCYEALQSGDTNLMLDTLKGLYNGKWYDKEWLSQKKELEELSPKKKKKILQEYFNENYKKNTFISGIIIDKLESENRNTKSYSSGYSKSINTSNIEPATILNTNEQVEKNTETNNTNSNINKKEALPSKNTTKGKASDQTPKTVTKTTTNTKTPISTTSTKNDKTKIANIIGGTTKASSIGAVTRETLSSSNLPVDESTSKDLSDSVIDKVNLDNVSEGISGTLSSAIDTINKIKSNSPLKLTKIKNMDMQDNSGNSFIPPIAGISTAAVAGIGTKMYIDKKEENKDETNSFFSKDDQKEIKEEKDTEEENKTMSKEDLIKAIEFNRK